MKKIIKLTMGAMLVIGVINFVLTLIFNVNIFVVEEYSTMVVGNQTIKMYVFNVHNYLQNIQTSIKGVNFKDVFPGQIPYVNTDFSNVENTLKTIANYIIYGLNFLVAVLSVLILAPLKLILYIVIVAEAIIGLDFSKAPNILNVINTIYTFNIPYIPQIT